MKNFTIGQLAKKVQVNVETIRYYERRGLITHLPRRVSGYRQYSLDAVARIQFIKSAKELGFSLKEISELLSLRVDPDTNCGDVKKLAGIKIADIKDKIQALQLMKDALMKLKAKCIGRGPVGECPIFEALETKKRS